MRTLWKITQILGEPGWTRSCQVLMDVYKFMPCIWRSHFGVVSAVSAMRVCVGARTLLHLLDTMWRNAPAGHISPETLQLQGHKTNTLSPFLWRRFKTSMRNLIQHNTTWYNMIQHLYIIWFTLGACCFLVCVDMFPSMACTHNASPFSGRHPNYALIGNYMKLYWPESSPKSARLRRKSNSKLQTPLWRQSFVSQMSSKIHMWLGFQWSLDHINVHSHTSLLRNLKKGKTKPSRTFDSARPELRIAQSENQTQIFRSCFDVQKFWAVLNSWELFPASHGFCPGCTLTLIVSKAIDTPCKCPYPAFRHSLCESEREPRYLNTNVHIYMYIHVYRDI